MPPPRRGGQGRGAAESHKRLGTCGTPQGPCLLLPGCRGRLSGDSFCWIGRGKPRRKFLRVLAGRARCGRLETEGRRARRSRASPPHRFTAELLLILPSSLITGVRQYQIRSALATLPPPPSLEQRLNKLNNFFQLKKTPNKHSPKKPQTKVKSSITKCSLGRFVATTSHR